MSLTHPNVILICVDQWRGDCLSSAGHPVVRTPYIDDLTLTGVRFDRAYAACPSCIAARASLFTGLTQRSHGRVGYKDGVPWNYPVTIASEFARQGYQTQAVGKLHVHPPRSQMGFHSVDLHDGFMHFGRHGAEDSTRHDDYLLWLRNETGRSDADHFETGLNCNSLVARPWDKEEYLHPTNWVTMRSIDFFRRRDTRKPFFLFTSYHRPHPPYDPPAWAFEQYLHTTMPEPPRGEWSKSFGRQRPGISPGGSPENSPSPMGSVAAVGRASPDMLQRARAGYYGHMTHIDHQVNRLIESLEQYDAGPTIICFVSDHGELMGDHDRWRKSLPFEGSARVPLILSAKDFDLQIKRGSVCRELVELRDVMPSLLDAAGLNVPESIEGKSFLKLARQQSDSTWRTHLHGEHTFENSSVHYITDATYKYIWHTGNGRELLFDMKNDPTELHDLSTSPSHAGELSRLRALLVQELAGREEGFVDAAGNLIAGRPVRPCLSHLH